MKPDVMTHRVRMVSTFAFTIFGVLLLTINGIVALVGEDSEYPLTFPGLISLGVAYYIHNWGSSPRGFGSGVDGN